MYSSTASGRFRSDSLTKLDCLNKGMYLYRMNKKLRKTSHSFHAGFTGTLLITGVFTSIIATALMNNASSLVNDFNLVIASIVFQLLTALGAVGIALTLFYMRKVPGLQSVRLHFAV